MEDQPILAVYTPNSDLAAGFAPGQLIWGRTGEDFLVGLHPPTTEVGQIQIDLLVGDVPLDDPAFRSWSDTFILGDWTRAYYNNGEPTIFGLNDFGFVFDFNPTLDSVQLFGSANNYQLLDVGVGSALFLEQETSFDAVGFLLGNTGLDLGASYFNFLGTTPPPGPAVPFARQLGTSEFDITPAIATDPTGNVFIAGGSTGSLGGENTGLRDAVIAKYDNSGNLLWTQQFGSSSSDTISSIQTDAQGNLFVTGLTNGNLVQAKQATTSDAFIAKYDADGNQLWIQQFGQNDIFQSFAIDVDAEGNAYITGIDVKPSETQGAIDDFWVAKYDTNGNQVWFTDGIGSIQETFDESYAITVSNDGSVYTTGWTLGDLEAPGANQGIYDTYISKFNNDGDLEWIRQFGTSDYEWGWGVDTDSVGNVYATGWTLGDLGGESAGAHDVWLTSYSSAGEQLWLQQFGSAGSDEAFDIFIDFEDNIFLTGYTNGNLGGQNAGSFDAWVAKFNISGEQLWLQQFGTPNFDQAYGITGDNNGNLFITGVTQGSFGSTNNGSFDGWTAKLDSTTGSLLNFSGVSNPVANSSSLSLLSNSSNSSSTNSWNTASTQPQFTEQDVDYITNFFKEFIASLGLQPDGSGIENLLSNPYGITPPPPPVSVPEPASGLGLLALAAVFCAGRMLKRSQRSSVES